MAFRFNPLVVKHEDDKVFCFVRNRYVVYGPEEIVRQSILHHLIQDLGVSPNDIELEPTIHKVGRPDIVVSHQNYPILLVECKAPSVRLSDCVFDTQAINYGIALKTRLIWVSNGNDSRFYASKDAGETYQEIEGEPDLINNVDNQFVYKRQDKLVEPVSYRQLFKMRVREDYSRIRKDYINTHWLTGNEDDKTAAAIIRLGEFIYGQHSFPQKEICESFVLKNDLGVRQKKMSNPGEHMYNYYRCLEIEDTIAEESFLFAFGFMPYKTQHLAINFPDDRVRSTLVEISLDNDSFEIYDDFVCLLHRRPVNIGSASPPLNQIEFLEQKHCRNLSDDGKPIASQFEMKPMPTLHDDSWAFFFSYLLMYAKAIKDFKEYAAQYKPERVDSAKKKKPQYGREVNKLIDEGKYQQAIDYANALIDRGGLTKSMEMKLLDSMYESADMLGDNDLRIESLEKLSVRSKDPFFDFIDLARNHYFNSKDKNKARYYIEKAEKIHPENDALYSLKGAIYLDKNNYRKAAHRFKKAYHLDEKNENYLFDLVVALMLNGEYEEALKYWDNLPNNDFKSDAINVAKKHSSLYSDEFTEYAFNQFPNDVLIVELYANMLYDDRKYEDALRYYKALKDLDQDNPFVHILVASALMMLHRHQEALEEINDLNFSNIHDRLTHQLTLAAIHKSLGNETEVEQALIKAKSLDAIESDTIGSYMYHCIVGNDEKCKEIRKNIDDGSIDNISYFLAVTEYILKSFGLNYYK